MADVNFNFTNPAGNPFPLTYLNITAPVGWSLTSWCDSYAQGPTDAGNQYFNTCIVSGTGLSAEFTDDAGTSIPPGTTQDLEIQVNFPTPAADSTVCGTFTSVFNDTLGTPAGGPSFQLCAFDPDVSSGSSDNSITLRSGSSYATTQYFVAGSAPRTLVADVGSDTAGIPVFFTSVDNYSCTVYTCAVDTSGVFSGTGVTTIGHPYIAWAYTNASGAAVVTFTPQNIVGNTGVTAYVGGGPFCDGYWYDAANPNNDVFGCDWTSPSNTIEFHTLASTPTTLTFNKYLVEPAPYPSPKYIGTHAPPPNGGLGNDMAWIVGGTIALNLADAYGNMIPFATVTGVDVSVSTSGGAVFNNAGANKTTINLVDGGIASAPNGGFITDDYYQSGTWGTQGQLSALIDGHFNGAFSLSVSSPVLITGTFDSATHLLHNCSFDPGGLPNTCSTAGFTEAGDTASLSYILSNPQLNVPITFYAYNTTAGYAGSWVGGSTVWDKDAGSAGQRGTWNVTVATDINGKASAAFMVDLYCAAHLCGAGAPTVYFFAVIPDPNDGGANDKLLVANSASTTTVAGDPVGLVAKVYGDSFDPPTGDDAQLAGFPGKTYYVDVILADKYGNLFAELDTASQIQTSLSASAGLLSATSPTIMGGQADTFLTEGYITWTIGSSQAVPSALTLTVSGVVGGVTNSTTTTFNVVSPLPTITAKSEFITPYNGVIYSKTLAVSFIGTAATSNGFGEDQDIEFGPSVNYGIFYKIDNGAASRADGCACASFAWHAINVVFTAGLHTITFWANDSASDMSATVSLQVLVDNSAPTITATTTTGSSLAAGSPVVFGIVDGEGDLNATSVVATSNSTATLTTTVTPVNNLGHSVTYVVDVNGLPSTNGHWKVTLNAKDLAGNAATAVSTIVKVTVPLAQSFVVVGTPSKGTVGGFSGINVSYQNLGVSSQTVFVFAVWKNGFVTEGVATSSGTVAAGATTPFFIPEPLGLPAGTYNVNLFVVTSGNNPVSITTTINASA